MSKVISVSTCLVHELTFDAGHDGALLDGRRLLEPVRVDPAQQLLLQVHVIEVVGDFIPVTLSSAKKSTSRRGT